MAEGGASLSAFLRVLVDRLASCDFIRIFAQRNLDHGLRNKLRTTLLALQLVLDDAEDKQITNKSVKAWLQELQHVFHQADDLLDEISTKALRDKLEEADHDLSQTQSSPSTKLVGFSQFFRPIKQSLLGINPSVSTSVYLSDDETESRMKVTISKLECLLEHSKSLKLRNDVERKPSQRLPTSSLVYEDEVCGRKDDREKIIQLLLSNNTTGNDIPVIPIVAMGGMGKTTLAQFVYNDARVNDNFPVKSSVCVSDTFDIPMITKQILDDVTSSNEKIDILDELQTKLKKSLAGKKFLIVLDDVWNDDYIDWDTLRRPFSVGAPESRIIVTTRNDIVASIMGTIPSYPLEQLPDEDCWSLFAKHAFVNGDCMAYPELESIGREIVSKCGGLPLAVKSLGGLLRSKLETKEWKNILKSQIWGLEPSIPPALRLSYHYLPSHLKQCFAYCSIFPKGHTFSKERLVQLWIALDFVQQPRSNNSVEDEGNNYFHELLSRSFFQRLSHGDTDFDFVMHDLIHDFAQDIFGDLCYRQDDDKPLVHISEKVCHFSYVRGQYDAFEKFKVVNEVKCLRTFMSYSSHRDQNCCLGNKVLHDMLPVLRCLRVLSLSNYQISELPQSIENLIHLRYLDLSRTRIKKLPDSVTTLCNLQMLNLSYCECLTELPVNMGKLINLRHLDIKGTRLTEMPTQMSRLKDLQHLTYFVVGKNGGSSISGLKELCNLRGKLDILGLENVVSGQDASEANLKNKKHLEGLVLKWSGEMEDSIKERDVFDKLQPHVGLKTLSIFNYGSTKFPDWLQGVHSFCNMVSLELVDSANCYSLPSIGQLPSLKHLRIEGMKAITIVGQEFYGDASSSKKPFQSLETLRFKRMEEWEEWHALGAGEFSCLLELSLVDCPKLIGELSIRFPSLRKIQISKCQRLVSNQIGMLLQGLPSLQELEMSEMTHLTELPPQLQNLSFLQKLEISVMPNLKKLPLELCRLMKLEWLGIQECPSLESVLDAGLPPMLKILRIIECEALQTITVASPTEGINICLEYLCIYNCSSLIQVSFPIGDLPPTLKTLLIRGCRSLEFPLPEEMEHSHHTSITTLEITSSCDLLKSLSLGLFPDLRELEISGCINLVMLSIPSKELRNLMKLKIRNCPRMVSFATGGLPAPNLTEFHVVCCENLKSLPQRMHTHLSSLQGLWILDCPEIESFPDGGLPSNLRQIHIYNCERLIEGRMDWGLQALPFLEEFCIGGKSLSEEVLESFPEEWLLPSTLTSLEIWFLPNLKRLNHKGLQHLTSLETLKLWFCPMLQSLPEEGLPNSLSFLNIHECPLLKPRCQWEKGEDWINISRIQRVWNNGEEIINLE